MLVFDGIQFFKDFHIRYTTQSANVSRGWAGTTCPFCSDHTDHLGLHLQSGAMSCWKCGKHSALEYVKAILRVPAAEAKTIYSRYLVKRVQGQDNKEERLATPPSEIYLPPPVFTCAEKKYMKKRNLTIYHQEKYDLRGGGLTGEWAYRIVIPIYYNKFLVSATARTISEEVVPKYFSLNKSLSLMNLKHIVLGMDFVNSSTIVVVEGPLDAIRGGDGFVASFGASLSDEQLLLLREYDTILFVRDSDAAGENFVKAAYTLATMCNKSIEVITLQGFKDVGEMDDKSIEDMRKELGLCIL